MNFNLYLLFVLFFNYYHVVLKPQTPKKNSLIKLLKKEFEFLFPTYMIARKSLTRIHGASFLFLFYNRSLITINKIHH